MPTTKFDSKPLEELTIDTALRNRADYFPEKPFVFYGPDDREVSYGEMNRTANAIGNSLRDFDVEIGDSVSVMGENPLSVLFAFFGIMKTGLVYSPINHAYKGQTLFYQLNDTDPDVFIIEDQYLGRLHDVADALETDPRLVVIKTDADSAPVGDRFSSVPFEQLREGSTEDPDIDTAWDDVASILYTSGTTGDPKGVSQQQRWVISNYSELGWRFQSPEDVTHTSLPLYHVGGLYNDILGSMLAGASVSMWDTFSPEQFWDRIEEYEASRTMLLSSMIPWLVNRPEQEDDWQNSLSKILMVPLAEDHRAIADRFGFDLVFAPYGSTELGSPLMGLVRCYDDDYLTPEPLRQGLTPDEVVEIARDLGAPVVREAPDSGWIGNADWKPGVELEIINERDETVPTGDVGELVGRPQKPAMLFKTYDGKPAETVESWENLWYHTGDAMYRDEEGHYYFVDRLGTVIRRRGENISSGQVQEIVNAYEPVDRSAAFPVPATEGGEDEVAVAVELAADATATEAEADLKAYLEDAMPEFMIPKYITFVDEIPTTETNKMEKYKLKEAMIDRHDLG